MYIKIEAGRQVEILIDWMTENLAFFFGGIKAALQGALDAFGFVLTSLPFFIVILALAAAAWFFANRTAGVFTAAGLWFIYAMGLWKATMITLSMVLVATVITLLIGIPLGILSARSDRFYKVVRPVLDFMQTMPAFVYLIPAVYFFDLGEVPGTVATVIFAMPPVIRLTGLGIREVPHDVVEACDSFGATSMQKLLKVQIPLAKPTILAGLNQTILLSLSMVVISAMIGAKGLGEIVLSGISQMNIGKGFEGGFAVVIIAMVLDRITQGLAKNKKTYKAENQQS